MENKGVLMTAPMPPYLEQELGKRFRLFKLWEAPFRTEFLERNSESISAVVGNAAVGADSELIDSLPNLEIVSNYSVGLDKIDLVKCKERGISVTNTPDVLTDDVADIAIGLALATLRKICAVDRFLRSGMWKSCGFDLTRRHVIDIYSDQGRHTSISHDKIILGAAAEAVRAQWQLVLLKEKLSFEIPWGIVCGKDGILTKALKVSL